MTFTDFFIKRPIFAWVINIVLILIGLVSLYQLTVRQYPRIESSIITITTAWEGASPTAIESQITKPLEDAFASLEGLDYMTSSSESQQSKIKLNFTNRSVDLAANDIRDRLGRSKLTPDEADTPTITKADADSVPVMKVVLTGDDFNSTELFDFAEHSLKNTLETVEGVATVDVAGGSSLQMNLTLDPIKMGAYHVTAQEVVDALKRQNLQQRPAGKLMDKEREFVLTTRACLKNPKEFSNIIVMQNQDQPIRLSDIGTVSICPEEELYKVTFNGKPGVLLSILAQSQSNPIEISKSVKKKIEGLKESGSLPKGMEISIASDRSIFIEHSINQVYRAIWEATILVLLVILFFLCSLRASLIPLMTIPISLISTFFIIYMLGFTINILTLLAIVLAIGLVVDDAIVVLENIYRYIEKGMKPMEAAMKGTHEIAFSIIAMTLTLAAVYTPIAFAPGMIAKMFKEFALTLAGAVLISGFVALTLSPAMCARLLKPHRDSSATGFSPTTWVSGKILSFLDKVDLIYTKGVRMALNYRGITIALTCVFFSISLFLGAFYLKNELAPPEDQGILSGTFQGSASSNLNYLSKYIPEIDKILKNEKDIENRLIIAQTNQESQISTTLIPWDQRKGRKCRDLLPNLRDQFDNFVGISSGIYCPSGFIAGGASEKPIAFNILTDHSYKELEKIGLKIYTWIKSQPGIDRKLLEPTYAATTPEFEVSPKNSELAHQLGIDADSISRTLQYLVRGSRISRFERESKLYPVRIWVGEQYRRSPEDILSLVIKGRNKKNQEVIIPLQDVVQIHHKEVQAQVEHFNKKRSFPIRSGILPGYGLGDVYASIKENISDKLPKGYSIEPIGELKRYLTESKTIYLIFGLALVFIFLVMAAQFESLKAPFIIILSVPLAFAGALITLSLMKGGTINIYSQIGFITLIGLITKHGILLVDFTNQERSKGKPLYEAIVEACRLRLRPILMTTFAMVLGAIPLAFATGAGAEARRQIGMTIVGGMSIGTLFTLFVVPVIYSLLSRKERIE